MLPKTVHDPTNCPPKMRLKTNKSIPSSNLFFKKNSMFSRHQSCSLDSDIEALSINKVTVAGVTKPPASIAGNKYYINETLNVNLVLYRGVTYEFDLSDASNATGGGHPLWFHVGKLIASDQVRGQTATYANPKNGVGASGAAAGTAGAKLTFVVPNNAPDKIYYVCGNHANMGSEGFVTVKTSGDFAKSKKHDSYARYLLHKVGKTHTKNKYNETTKKFEKNCNKN